MGRFDVESLYNCALVQYETKKLNEAKENLKKIIYRAKQNKMKNSQIWIYRGSDIYRDQEKYEDARYWLAAADNLALPNQQKAHISKKKKELEGKNEN